MTELRYKKLSNELPALFRGSVHAAGLDLYNMSDDVGIFTYSQAVLSTGIAVEIPEGHFGQISIRSGLGFKRQLVTHHGIIDSDYRGEIKVLVYNHSSQYQTIKYKERFAQLVIIPYLMVDFEEVDELSETVRGEGGYGSTGAR